MSKIDLKGNLLWGNGKTRFSLVKARSSNGVEMGFVYIGGISIPKEHIGKRMRIKVEFEE